jgi:hypothetical protein
MNLQSKIMRLVTKRRIARSIEEVAALDREIIALQEANMRQRRLMETTSLTAPKGQKRSKKARRGR